MADAKIDNNNNSTMLGVSSADDTTPVALAADPTTKRLRVDALNEESGHGTVGDGTATVTTNGTRVQLHADTDCKRVYIEAHESNTGTIVVGGSTVVAASSTRRGRILLPTQGDWFKVSNLNLLYIDSTADGDKVNFFYEN